MIQRFSNGRRVGKTEEFNNENTNNLDLSETTDIETVEMSEIESSLSKEELVDMLNIFLDNLRDNNTLEGVEEFTKRKEILILGNDYEDIRLSCTLLEILDDYYMDSDSNKAYIKLGKVLTELTGKSVSNKHIEFNSEIHKVVLWHPGTFYKWRVFM